MPREGAPEKARRLLAEGRVRIVRVGDPERPGLIVAEVRGDSGEQYHCGHDDRKNQWRCTCVEMRGRCSHIQSVQLVTTVERTGA